MTKIPMWSRMASVLMVLALALKVLTVTFWAGGTVREVLDGVFIVVGALAAALYLGAGVRGLAKARRHEYPKSFPGKAADGLRKRMVVSSALRLSIALTGLYAISGTFVSAVRSGRYGARPLGWGMEVIGHLPMALWFAVVGICAVTVVWAAMTSGK
ncbi:hypothetical protein [Streptosporangium sp. NPDC003464]